MDLVKLALEKGAHKATCIATSQLRFCESFVEACEQNYCGRYGKSYTCPPHVGEIADLIAKVKRRQTAIIWQTVHELEDSFDYKSMQRGQALHNNITFEIAQLAKTWRSDILALNAGGCFLCKTCAVNCAEPCRFPALAISSLEAHGIDVASVQDCTDMRYVNGLNTVTFFSGLFY